jgi:hypothetical protein
MYELAYVSLCLLEEDKNSQAQWLIPVIQVTQKEWFEVSPGEKSASGRAPA